MTNNRYAGLWDVSLDAAAIHAEVQRHVDNALLDFASGLTLSPYSSVDENDAPEFGITVSIRQSRHWAEGPIEEAEESTVSDIIFAAEDYYGDSFEQRLQVVEAAIAKAREMRSEREVAIAKRRAEKASKV